MCFYYFHYYFQLKIAKSRMSSIIFMRYFQPIRGLIFSPLKPHIAGNLYSFWSLKSRLLSWQKLTFMAQGQCVRSQNCSFELPSLYCKNRIRDCYMLPVIGFLGKILIVQYFICMFWLGAWKLTLKKIKFCAGSSQLESIFHLFQFLQSSHD